MDTAADGGAAPAAGVVAPAAVDAGATQEEAGLAGEGSGAVAAQLDLLPKLLGILEAMHAAGASGGSLRVEQAVTEFTARIEACDRLLHDLPELSKSTSELQAEHEELRHVLRRKRELLATYLTLPAVQAVQPAEP